AVQSHYLRILAANPKIARHNFDYAKDGARMDDLLRQANIAASGHPDYVTIEIGGNDLCQGVKPTPLQTFEAELAAALRALQKGSPNGRIFVTSLPFSVEGYDSAVGPYFVAHGYSSDGSTCDPQYDSRGVPNAAQEADLQKLVDTYDAALGQV